MALLEPAEGAASPPRLDAAGIAAGVQFLRAADPALAALIDAVGPCTLHPQPDLFFALVNAIIAQQISTKAKDSILARVVALYTPEGAAPRFPTAQALLDTPDDALRAVGCSWAKVRYLKDLSARVVGGQLELERLPEMADDAVVAELVAVKGVGRWTAEMLLIFALGRPDVWPVDDLGIVVGAQRLLGLAERPTARALREIGERWRPYRTLVSWYLWRMPRAGVFSEAAL